jgi:hypothetical protein
MKYDDEERVEEEKVVESEMTNEESRTWQINYELWSIN